MIAERESEIQEIETGIHELNDIFHDLNKLVGEQGDMIGTQALDDIYSLADSFTVGRQYRKQRHVCRGRHQIGRKRTECRTRIPTSSRAKNDLPFTGASDRDHHCVTSGKSSHAGFAPCEKPTSITFQVLS